MRTPYWLQQDRRKFGKLENDLGVDVAIIGGGMAGVTAAYLLKQAGKRVALVEKEYCGGGDTGHTTAHLAYVTDERLSTLVKDFGRDHAQAAWDAGYAAIRQIDENQKSLGIGCDFRWAPGYLHAPWNSDGKDERESLEEDARLAKELGFDAAFMSNVPLYNRPGVRFSNQAQFHPFKYLSGLLEQIPGDGCYVFEQTAVEEVADEPLAVGCGSHRIACDYLVIATHNPLAGKAGFLRANLFQSKLAAYNSYVVGARLPAGPIAAALFWDTSDPYHYLRFHPRDAFDYAIFGGEDHKTGQDENINPEERFQRLETLLKSFLPQAQVIDRWSGQVIETNDGLPLMGETAERQFVATGFAGNGMTFGSVAGIMACDAALGKRNPWSDLFHPGRTALKAGAWDYLKENVDYPYYMIKDRLASPASNSPESVAAGEGKIVLLGGERVALYRDQQGELTALSPVCTHMGCLVHWNSAEATWDCPCHGSRFHPTGEVLAGPTNSPLPHLENLPVPTPAPSTSRAGST